MGSKVSLAEMSQEEIDTLFKTAFTTPKVLDKIKHNFDFESIDRVLNPKKYRVKKGEGKAGGRGEGRNKGGGGGWGKRRLQPPRPKRKVFEKKEYVAEPNKLEGQFMMTTFILGGPLEINETKYGSLDQNRSV